MQIENNAFKAIIKDGKISELYNKVFGEENNISLKGGKCGSACFTFVTDDIKTSKHEFFTPYEDRTANYDVFDKIDDVTFMAKDTENKIITKYLVDNDKFVVSSCTENENISEFGVNLELNFLGRKGNDFKKQFLPTSPYTSQDNNFFYYIMTNPDGKFLVVTTKTKCDGWKIDYSAEACAHYITNVKMLASFDRAYKGSGKKNIEFTIQVAKSLEEAFLMVSENYDLPVCRPVLSGNFDGCGLVETFGKYDFFAVKTPSGKTFETKSNIVEMTEFGFYTVTPMINGKSGVDCVLWNGKNVVELFDKSCDSIRKPYHNDENLCEGGCFLWALLANMNFNKNFKYDKIAKEELDIIMGKSDYIQRKTIVPHKTKTHAPYHIYGSDRVQEQFFGVSVLLEAYKLYESEEIYEFMINTLFELRENYIKNGMVFNGTDYTTVCAPMIPIVDVTLLLKSKNDERYKLFEETATQMAEYLFKRGYNFPTEGEISNKFDTEYEDGSISCTALSLLYYCRYIKRNENFEKFAFDVLRLHEAWTTYSPDAKMNNSSFRWWETIWEGDGEGPAICCGHAWTIWKGEALFHGGLLFKNDKMLLDSWNAYITNFCKTEEDGKMYACYEVDYIRGGGHAPSKGSLITLKGENLDIKYEVAHSYPKHYDNSLSRYAWARGTYTWLETAAVIKVDEKIVVINGKIENNVVKTSDKIKQIYVNCDEIEVENKELVIL